jgi:hypothetical protein
MSATLVAAYKTVLEDFSQAVGWDEEFHSDMITALTTRLYELEHIWPFFDIVASIEDEMPDGEALDNKEEY